ncbi:interferon-induced very large GTPase 1-like protein [Labeo rohita]|uniref:Interferon-induced very large GTPase 1-like protein n=1 Tax=Labeo rohita TaxID=84645 RepID=A0A498MGN4_LABRO|nr:interferon-induced very large GTPase 1-like protein [Labeo rohita]
MSQVEVAAASLHNPRKISECHVTVINITGLHETELNLDPANDVIGQLVHENKISAFIFVVRLRQLTDADKMGLEWLQRVFGEEVLQFVIILFTYEAEEECDTITDDLKKNPVLEQLLEKCGGRYHTCSKIMNKEYEMVELMYKIDCLFENKQQHYTGEMYNTAREREDLKKTQCGSDHSFPNLTIVSAGNSAAIQFGQDNILLGEEQPNIENVEISRILPLQRKISERHVTVINITGLHETELNLDPANDVIGQLVHENKINAFIFVVRLDQLTDADKMGLEWLQQVFGEEVLPFVMILFTYEAAEECDTITDDLKKNLVLEQLLEKCGGGYHTSSKIMNNQYEMIELMNKIDRLFVENKQQHYTGEMYNTAREREDLKKSHCESGEISTFVDYNLTF